MPNRYFDEGRLHPDNAKGGKMPKKGGKQTDDGRERGTAHGAEAKFKHTTDPNESVPKLGHVKGAE